MIACCGRSTIFAHTDGNHRQTAKRRIVELSSIRHDGFRVNRCP